MKWLEERLKLASGSDGRASVTAPSAIAKTSDEVLDGEIMVGFVRDYFGTQKSFGEFIGVGESTVAGWMKSETFPDYAKRAALAAFYANSHSLQLDEARREAARPKVVKDGARYLIVQFRTDETGVSSGTIIARDIPSAKTALMMAGTVRIWELLDRAEEYFEDLIGSWKGTAKTDDYERLAAEIDRERVRAFDGDGLAAGKPHLAESSRVEEERKS